MVKLATFFDPDGNRHMLYQSLGAPEYAARIDPSKEKRP
jgi:hypothetical protein